MAVTARQAPGGDSRKTALPKRLLCASAAPGLAQDRHLPPGLSPCPSTVACALRWLSNLRAA